jgi:hypothetical protein
MAAVESRISARELKVQSLHGDHRLRHLRISARELKGKMGRWAWDILEENLCERIERQRALSLEEINVQKRISARELKATRC